MASQPAPYNSPHQFSQQCFSWIEASWNRLIGLKWGKTNDGYLICSRELYLQSLLWLAMYLCISQLLLLHIQWFSSCLLQISASFWMLSVAFPPWEHKYKHLCVLPCSPLNPAFSREMSCHSQSLTSPLGRRKVVPPQPLSYLKSEEKQCNLLFFWTRYVSSVFKYSPSWAFVIAHSRIKRKNCLFAFT